MQPAPVQLAQQVSPVTLYTHTSDSPPQGRPCYIILMPFHVSDFTDNYRRLLDRLNIIRTQSFGSGTAGQMEAAQRIWIVIGLNCKGTDAGVLQALAYYVHHLVSLHLPMNVAFCGFTWNANEVPYQRIRETVKNIAVVAGVQNRFASNPTYIVCMDDDFEALDRHGPGIFTQVDALIHRYPNAELLTLGYSTDHPSPAVRFAVDLEQNVRRTLARRISLAAYYSEAFFVTRLQGQLHHYSFQSARGGGQRLESLAWIENGLRNGTIHPQNCIYGGPRGVITPINRLLIGTKIINTALCVDLAFVKALRGFGQNCLDTLQWADRVNFTAPQRYDTHERRSMLSLIFNAFDPIHLYEFFKPFSASFIFWRAHYFEYTRLLWHAFQDINILVIYDPSQRPPRTGQPWLDLVSANAHERDPNNYRVVPINHPYVLSFDSFINAGYGLSRAEVCNFFNLQLRNLRVTHKYLCYNYHNPQITQSMSPWTAEVIAAAIECSAVIFQELNRLPLK